MSDFRDQLNRPGVLITVIASLFAAMLPLWLKVPMWVALFSAATLLLAGFWREKLTRWLRVVLVVAATVGVALQHNALFSREAGLSLIVMMTSFKLLEMRGVRDLMLLIAISFFLLFCGFLFYSDLASNLYLFFCLPLPVMALLRVNQHSARLSSWQVIRRGFQLLLFALPMIAAFYLFFPRLHLPLWVLPASGGSTGFSDELSFGDVNSLALNDDLAFRASFNGAAPARSQLYWRAVVLDEFDGYTWRRSEQRFTPEALQPTDSTLAYTIVLQPHRSVWLPVLDTPVSIDLPYRLVGGRTARSLIEIRRVQSYNVVSTTAARYQSSLNDAEKQQWLQLPEDSNPRTLAWGKQLIQQGDADAIARYLQQYIFNEDFYYTLTPDLLEDQLVDDFWFNKRRGFCEHYASAVAYLLRAAGVPTRVIGGYQGGEFNTFGGFYSVLQADAHAWVEYWSDNGGWRRLDPTAAIAPSRIEPDLRQRVRERLWRNDESDMTQVWEGAAVAVVAEFWLPARRLWKNADMWFENAVLQFNRDAQQDWLRKWGLEDVSPWTLVRWMVIMVFSGLFIGVMWLWFAAPSRTSQTIWMQKFERKMSFHKLQRDVHETPSRFFSRCAQALPEKRKNILAFGDTYERAIFAGEAVSNSEWKKQLKNV